MAFIQTTMGMGVRKPATAQENSCPTRREALQIFAGTLAASLLAGMPGGALAEEKPQLPPGALQFTRLLSAQKQWNSLSQLLGTDGEIQDADWDNLRGYLRQVYSVSGDMEFMAKPWNAELREKASETIRGFRKTVKGMDKPAMARDREAFTRMHGEVVGYFEAFFQYLKEGSTGDVPEDL